MSINKAVIIWARKQIGKKVGAGECWDLADRALRRAGAKSSTESKVSGYVWGTEVSVPDQNLQPGDILQFKNWKATVNETGGGWVGEGTVERGYPVHTAIVDRVLGDGWVIVLEQNLNKVKKVVRNKIPLRAGKVKLSGQKRTGDDGSKFDGELTVEVRISGRVWAYRPAKAAD